jgi:hypothetical protein
VVTVRLFTTLVISIQPCIVHLNLDCDVLQLSQRAQVAGFKISFLVQLDRWNKSMLIRI